MSEPAVLEVADLGVRIGGRTIVEQVSFAVQREHTVGIVGESGSGKSMTVLAATGLLDAPGARVSGSSTLTGGSSPVQLVGAKPKVLRRVHGARIGFVFQDPGTSLNPLLTLERQITESLQTHRDMTRRAATQRATELLEAVGLPDPATRLHAYPHQLSGGQKQRAMIAIALACDPELLIADEPTTALDVTTQAQIIDLVRDLQHDFGTAVVWISHDLGVIGQVADDVTVLRAGRTVEQAPILTVFDSPRDDYTRDLLAARPVLDAQGPPEVTGTDELLTVEGLDVRFTVSTPVGRSTVHAVRDVSFTVRRGATLGLVGESGSGKSTVAAALTGLARPDGGTATLDGTDVFGAKGSAARALRRRIGLVFQDPFSSLNPRARVATSIAEPLSVHDLVDGKAARTERVAELLERVGLPSEFAQRYPHELSGGMKQRVGIARALVSDPDVLLMDEPFAALDAQTRDIMQAELLRIWHEAKKTVLFVTHQIEEAVYLSDRVIVMTKRPGRTKTIIDVPLERPRGYEMRVTPEFNKLKLTIWNELKDEIETKSGPQL